MKLLVTHDLATIQSMCNRAVWFDEGQIQAVGHPTDVVMSYMQRIAVEENQARQLRRALEEDEEEQDEENDDELAKELEEEVSLEERTDTLENEVQADDEGEIENIELEEEVEEEDKQRWGTGEIEIQNVEFLDGDGSVSFVFQTGRPMEIRIHYSTENPIDEPIFGLAIYKQDSTHVCGPNTKFGNLTIPRIEGEGYVSYKISELPLLEGTFLLSLAVIDQSDTITYDYLDRLYSFSVYPGETQERYGIVTLLGEWAWEEGSVGHSMDDELLLIDELEQEQFAYDLDDVALLD